MGLDVGGDGKDVRKQQLHLSSLPFKLIGKPRKMYPDGNSPFLYPIIFPFGLLLREAQIPRASPCRPADSAETRAEVYLPLPLVIPPLVFLSRSTSCLDMQILRTER